MHVQTWLVHFRYYKMKREFFLKNGREIPLSSRKRERMCTMCVAIHKRFLNFINFFQRIKKFTKRQVALACVVLRIRKGERDIERERERDSEIWMADLV